ncbi:MAG TPA: hypothetical protein PKK12_09985 [Candidatus Aminicenantes bacterium]|nr:hypothetical protein [Candidatus Aminicenantes bacterium]
MNRRIAALTVGVVVGLGLLAASGHAMPEKRGMSALASMKFGLHMAENNLFEARFLLCHKEAINLSADQEKRIEGLMLGWEEKAIRRGGDLKVMELRFATLLKDQKIDRQAMEKMARDIGAIRTDLQVDHLNYLIDLRDILSAEQVKQLETLRRDRPEGPRERRMERHPGPNAPKAPGDRF